MSGLGPPRTHHNDLRLGLEAWNAYELTQDVLTEVGDDALRETLSMTLTGNTTLPVDQSPSRMIRMFKLSNPSLRAARENGFYSIRQHARGWNRPGLVGAG